MPRIIHICILLISALFASCTDLKTNEENHGLSYIPRSQFTYRGVVDRSIKLNFIKDPQNPGRITAMVQTEYDYNDFLNFEWKLGEGVSLKEGQLTGQINSLKKNQPVKFEILVNGFDTDTKRFVRFEILGSNPQKRIFVDGIASSQSEKSFEKIVQEIEEFRKYNQ